MGVTGTGETMATVRERGMVADLASIESVGATVVHVQEVAEASRELLDRALEAEVGKLVDEFGTLLPRSVVEAEFTTCVRSFESARIRLYVPVLSYRNARQALRQRAVLAAGRSKRAA